MLVEVQNNGGHLLVKNLPPMAKIALFKGLSLSNPTYHQLIRMGNYRSAKWAGEFVKYYHENKDGSIIIGRGNFPTLLRYLQNTHTSFKCVENVVDVPISIPITVNATLRDYQTPVVQEFIEKDKCEGLIILNTGWGKTIFSLKIIEHYKQRTLIVVPRGHLLAQFQKDIKDFTGRIAGTVQGQTFDIRDITIGTIETVKKHKDKLAGLFGIVIIDEAHLAITSKIISFIQGLRPKYLYGMTGSPMRSDGQSDALKFVFGEPIVENYRKHATPTIHVHHSNVRIPVRDYPSIIEEQVLNHERNALIADVTKELIGAGRTVLVLTKRVTHTQLLETLLPDHGIIPIYAQSPQKAKAELLDKLRTDKMQYSGLLGTAALLGTGLDISKIDSVVISCDIKSKALLIQCVGRALRLLEGKPDPLIIDIHDNQNIVLHRQYLERMKYYKEKGYNIIEKNLNQKALW